MPSQPSGLLLVGDSRRAIPGSVRLEQQEALNRTGSGVQPLDRRGLSGLGVGPGLMVLPW